MRKPYPTDLSDAEWNYIKPHMPAPKGYGRPRTHDLREILNAVFYFLKSGCQWRLLPHDFPRWPTLYHYFRTWRIDGTWEKINRAIRQRLRVRLKRDPQPSAGVVDSQSVKTTAVGGQERGYDGGKKIKGLRSATSWWTLRVSCSERRSTWPKRGGPRRDQDAATGSRRAIPPPVSPVGGRGLQGTRARTGSRRPWGGAWISWSARENPPRKRC